MLFLLIIIGSSIFVSIAILHIRKSAFEKQLEELAERKRRRLGIRTLTFSLSKRDNSTSNDPREEAVASGAVRGHAIQSENGEDDYRPTFATRIRTASMSQLDKPDVAPKPEDDTVGEEAIPGHITFAPQVPPPRRETTQISTLQRRKSFIPSNSGVAVHSMADHPRNAQPFVHDTPAESKDGGRPRSRSLAKLNKYFESISGLIGRNSQFYHLSEKERRALGGIEYDAICLLSWLVPIYFILFQLFGAIGVGAWLQLNRPEVTYTNGEHIHRYLRIG
jgi:hypothetical protein